MESPHDPALLLLGIYPKEIKTHAPTTTCIQMFIVALFIRPKDGNNPKVH
jgi:hypothetical protein